MLEVQPVPSSWGPDLMDALSAEEEEDLKKIQASVIDSSGKVFLTESPEIPKCLRNRVSVENCWICVLPRVIQQNSKVKNRFIVEISAASTYWRIHYSYISSNVYASGLICLGQKWVPTEGLDLLAKRIIQIIIFDPSNPQFRVPCKR